MFKPEQVFEALQKEFPGESCVKISTRIGVGHTGIAKLKYGKGIGLDAAKHLADKNPKYVALYKSALKETKRRQIAGAKKRETIIKHRRRNRLDDLSRSMQNFCGYFPMENK